MSDEGNGSGVIEAPAIGVRKEMEKLKGRFEQIELLNQQHTAAMIDFTKAHNGHVVSSQKTATYLAKTIDDQSKEIKLLREQIDLIIAKLQDRGLW